MISSWDGWKALLEIEKLLPEGVQLPPRNPDPLYIPTPPKAEIGRISARGRTVIEFNEDVFEYEDLKNKKVPLIPPEML